MKRLFQKLLSTAGDGSVISATASLDECMIMVSGFNALCLAITGSDQPIPLPEAVALPAGATIALALRPEKLRLSQERPAGFALAATIAGGDAARLQTIPGVGKKLAERIVVECRDGAALLAASGAPAPAPARGDGVLDEAISALVNLGYKRAEAERAVEGVGRPAAPLEDVVRAALQGLAG